jgi:hypothetical protein
MITHTMADLQALPSEDDRAKARGFVERAGMIVAGGLPYSEMPLLTSAVALSEAEQNLLASWSAPTSWDTSAGRQTEPPGRGKFLVKVGGRPGIPISVALTETERETSNTNKRWAERSRVGTRDSEVAP